MPVPPWVLYGGGGGRADGSISTCSFTFYPPKAPPSTLVATGRAHPPPKDIRRRQKQQQQQPINKILEEALEECSEEEGDASASSSTAAMSVVVPPVFGSYPYDSRPASAADVPSVLLRCKRAEEQQEVLLLAAAAAISAAMRQQLQTICRIVRTHAAVGALELLQRRSNSAKYGGGLCEFLPVVIMLVGADVEDHRLAVRMLQLQLQQEAKCCCGGRRTSRSKSKENLFLKQVVLRASNCTSMQSALRVIYGQIKGSSCCSSCIGRSNSSSSKSDEGDVGRLTVAEELAADAAATAAWGKPAAFCAQQQQQQLLLQCLEGRAEDSTIPGGATQVAADDDEGTSLGHDISRRIGQLWRKQLQQHHRGFCCTWRRMGDHAAVRTRSQQQQRAAAGANSESSSSDASLSGDSSEEEGPSVAPRGSSNGSTSSSALVIVLEELEAFAPRTLSQLLLLLALLRTEQGIPVVVLASAAASAVAVQQLLEPATLRLLQIDAAVLLRPSAVYDALLQLLLCCPASTPFVLPAAAIEELQELLLDQGTSVLQLLRVLRMLLYKFFAEHPFSFLSIDARAVVPPISSSSKDGGPEVAPAVSSPVAFCDGETLERRVALLAAAVLTPHQEEGLLQQLSKFPLLHAELCAAVRGKLEPSCCRTWRIQQQQQQRQQQQQQHQQPATKEGCSKTPICGAIARASAMLQQWWGCPALAAATDAKQSAASRTEALLQVLPAAALQLLERRVAASIAMRLLVVLQQHVLQQRQAFALNAEETAAAAAAASSMGSSSTLPAVSLMLQILGSGRAQGYHDYLLQGREISTAVIPRIVSLICEEMRRVAGACSRIGGLVTTLVSEALSAAATTGRVAAVPHALLMALQQFSRQSHREWAILMQLERRMEQQQQQSAHGGKASDLFRMMNKLIELLELTCQQQQRQRGPGARAAFVSGLARRASIEASSWGSRGNISGDSDSALCSRFQSWARDCLLHFLLPLPQWHPLGCEVAVWSLSYAAAEQPQYLASVLAVPKAPAHRAEAAASDALARLQPLRPIEVLQQLACLSSCALEYHRQATKAADLGKGMGKDAAIVTDDTGLLYRRIAFGSRRIALWALFCSFCNDLIEATIQQRPHLRDQEQQQAKRQHENYGSSKGKPKARKRNKADEVEQSDGPSPARIALEMKVLQELQVEAEAGSAERHTVSPSSLLHHLFLRFGVALCTLEHLGLVRLPSAATSADDLLLRTPDAEGAAAGEGTAASDAEAESDAASEQENAIGPHQQNAASEVHTPGRKKRSARTCLPSGKPRAAEPPEQQRRRGAAAEPNRVATSAARPGFREAHQRFTPRGDEGLHASRLTL